VGVAMGKGGVAVGPHFHSTSCIIRNYQWLAADNSKADSRLRKQKHSKSTAKAKAQQKQSTFWLANYFHLVAELVSVGSGQDYVAFVFRPTKIAFDWHDGCCCLESRRQAFGAMI